MVVHLGTFGLHSIWLGFMMAGMEKEFDPSSRYNLRCRLSRSPLPSTSSYVFPIVL
jgi:hypothetical protein